jgi:GT2 family glycosyltransferase/glycosyltransferase involved in cell wall biosynthesis
MWTEMSIEARVRQAYNPRMAKRNATEGRPPVAAGLLVLGMHRSGTSALARVLDLCGADIGARITDRSAGNETGHWEDAFAVEAHEQLLAAYGAKWDTPLCLPSDWDAGEPARAAEARVAAYLAGDRASHPLWAVKDPRLCLFAPLWIEAARDAGQALGAVLVLRHPLEVAASLAARDGIGEGRALLLWLEYTLASVAAAEGLPNTVIGYESLLDDWRGSVDRMRSLPGGERLRSGGEVAAAVDAFLDRGMRHHESRDDRPLPDVVAGAWNRLSACLHDGGIPRGTASALQADFAPVRELLRPVIEEARVGERRLWERVGRAEAVLGEAMSAERSVPADLQALRDAVERQHVALIDAFSRDVARMQDVAAQAMQVAASREGEAGMARALGPRLDAVEDGVARNQAALVEAISVELRRMQDAAAQAMQAAAAREGEGALARALGPRLDAVEDGVARNQAALVEAISVELRRMQDAAAQAMQAAAAREREAEIARALGPRLDAVADGVARNQAALVDAISVELRRMQDVASEAARQSAVDREAAETARRAVTQADASRARLEAEAVAAQARIAALEAETAETQARLAALVGDAARADAQFRELSYEAARLREHSTILAQIQASRSWRWTRPFRYALRVLSGRSGPGDAREFQRRLRGLRARLPFARSPADAAGAGIVATMPRAEAGTPPPVTLKPAEAGLPDVFVWAVIDWHFRTQRPQHLARALAGRGHRVFYISNNFVDSAQPGFRADPLDASGRLFQVHLNLAGAPPIYFGLPDAAQADAIRASLAELLRWSGTHATTSLVHHPYWSPFARMVPNARVVYDCMDHHAGFENNASAVIRAEHDLLADADLVVVTSSWLEQEVAPRARATALVRNAGDASFFAEVPADVFRDPDGRQVIGYFGAIAEWFDVELVRKIALAHPDKLVLLIGSDTIGASGALAGLRNVRFAGEVPYARLPYWLHGFDVALLPFRVIDLTLATNPVKVYEYLAAGKPVVAVDVPEMAQFDGLVRVARDHADFVAGVTAALDAPASAEDIAARRLFAEGQTWSHRALELDNALATIEEPVVSVIVLTYNNLDFSRNCLFSIEHYSDYPNLEVIVVDNASSDGSPDWLREWAEEPSRAGHRRKLILNDANLGFAAGNNVGLREATGEYLVLLNNDTYVTRGWARSLCAHLRRDPALGIVGPVTNNIGNEAKLDLAYDDIVQMHHVAGEYTRAHPGGEIALRTAAFFCVAMPRHVFERVGELDEAFGVGFFEDDDYCRRVELAGWRVACAEDVFVHHHLSASFDQLKAEAKKKLFDANKAIYEAKWGAWQPHEYRQHA